MATRTAQDYVETLNPKGYVSNREITNLDGNYLVKGSKNVRIVNGEKVASSKRYTLKGGAKDVNSGITTSSDWKTNTKQYRNIRGYMDGASGEIEVWYNNAWVRIKNGYSSTDFQWTPVWSPTELIDVLLGVNGTDTLFMWSGGIAEVASVTTNTITKKGYLTGTTIAFNNNGASNDTITDSANGFLTAGFAVGDELQISGTTGAINDGFFTILTVTAGTITIIENQSLQTQASGATVIVKWKNNGTWAESRFLVSEAGRSVRIGGTTYTYTGGEGTGTLTGLTLDPVALGVVAGDRVMQSIKESTPSALDNGQWDLIGVLDNHVYIGSTRTRVVKVSKNDDYDDFTVTSPVRIPGEGFTIDNLDSCPTGFVSDEGAMYISAGDDDWYKVTLVLTADQTGESVVIEKLKTAPGQSAVAQGAIARIKNGVAFLSTEKAIETLSNVENFVTTQNVPISDDIKDDLEAYNLTDADMKYFKRSMFIALPHEGLLLEYDFRFGYWQPPQEISISKLAIIDGNLCGHSSNSNETYILFDGYNDNGAPFKAVAAFGYENYGNRFSLKNFDELGSELYMSRNTEVKNRVLYEYRGSSDIREFTITANAGDDTVFTDTDITGLGKKKLGDNPLGTTISEVDDLLKVRVINTTSLLDFFERQRVFESESPDCRFEILAFGENAQLSDNEPTFIRK